MVSVVIGATAVRECGRCEGLWLDVASFTRICAEREQQSAVLGGAAPAPTNSASDARSRISYVPCPECSQLMNRINFGRCSGVIVDVCRGHGTWFDRDELSRIVEFIHGGGLEAARAKEKAEIAAERDRLRQDQVVMDGRMGALPSGDDHRIIGLASARGLLKLLSD